MISLGSFDKRMIKSSNGQEKMIHAIQSTDYLKPNPSNFIYFDFSTDKRHICIDQEFVRMNSKAGAETAYENIFRLKIHVITLRELMFFQSLYVCSTQTEILRLVEAQPRPAVFFKSFLELDGTNMASILAFDSRCMKSLLRECCNESNHPNEECPELGFACNTDFFDPNYPLFYKNKMVKTNNREKFFYRSAVLQSTWQM